LVNIELFLKKDECMKRMSICLVLFAYNLYGMQKNVGIIDRLRKTKSQEYLRLPDEDEQESKTKKVTIDQFTQEDFEKQASLYVRRAARYTLPAKQCTQAEDLADLMKSLRDHLSDESIKGTLDTVEHGLRNVILFSSTVAVAQKTEGK
jgi:hypothetical protein